MVDYSKWDKLEVSSDEDEDGEEEGGYGPQVLRIGEGESVTLPGRNVTINSRPAPPAAHAHVHTPPPPQAAAAAAAALPPPTGAEGGDGGAVTALGGDGEFWARRTRNGAACWAHSYVWSQTAEDVTVRLLVPVGTASRAVSVEHVAEGNVLRVLVAGAVVCDKPLHAAVEPASSDDTGIDWELSDTPTSLASRLLNVTFPKAQTIVGRALWWRAAFKGDPEVDPAALQDRSQRDVAKAQQFMANFAEAQRLFRERVAARPDTRTEVVVDMDEAATGEEDGGGAAAAAAGS